MTENTIPTLPVDEILTSKQIETLRIINSQRVLLKTVGGPARRVGEYNKVRVVDATIAMQLYRLDLIAWSDKVGYYSTALGSFALKAIDSRK